MDWDKLKSFYEIAISRSISKASAKLNISQSALSRQIQDLEYDLKTPLFISCLLYTSDAADDA
mgnify:CR=1 FL=1